MTDAAGTLHGPAGADARIVSLVPSVTELLCALGLAPQLVGRTGFCTDPPALLRGVPKVGGTKDVDLVAVRRLAPSHVVVNVDENRRETAEALREFVGSLIVTHPLGPLDNPPLYRLLGGIFGRQAEAEALCRQFDAALQRARRPRPTKRVLYLIWRDPWMTVSRDTYVSRMLALFGWETWPAAAEARYPCLRLEDCAGSVEHVLLSSEPYAFREKHREEVERALPGTIVRLIDGAMTSWYGSRAIEALDYLDAFTNDPDPTTRGRKDEP
jgi:ABC-type Fe3+-hydroxamate transport system substrate-binding protein